MFSERRQRGHSMYSFDCMTSEVAKAIEVVNKKDKAFTGALKAKIGWTKQRMF